MPRGPYTHGAFIVITEQLYNLSGPAITSFITRNG